MRADAGPPGPVPAPQREALEIVFGLDRGAAPDRFLVGLAALSLLSEAAEERPLLCIVDDAQWLDGASARTLAFVARRLFADSIGLVFAARGQGEELRGLSVLEVRGLSEGDARALLEAAVRFLLDDTVRDRIVAETRGNPLALLELPRGLTATQLAGGLGLVGPAALSGRIEETFERRLDTLPADTRQLLVVASAEPLGDPLLLWRAAATLGIGMTASDAAEADGLLSIGERVTFRHPLVRRPSTARPPPDSGEPPTPRWRPATDTDTDPDRRAWHLASAATGPDEEVALELEDSAGRAQSRGGLASSAAFLERAVALSGDPARRTGRAIAAAEASLSAGAFETALAMLAAAEAGSLDELQRARVDLLRAEAAFSRSRGNDAPPLLLAAAKTLEPLDPTLARQTYLDAWGAALFAGELAVSGSLQDVSRDRARRAQAGGSRASLRSAARGLCAAVHRRARGGDPGGAGSGGSVRGRGRRSRGTAALGLAGDRRGRHGVGLRHLHDGRRARRPSGTRDGRAGRARRRRQRACAGQRALRRLREGRGTDRRGRCRHGGDRDPDRAVRRARARRVPGPRGRLHCAHRRARSRRRGPAGRAPPSSTGTGRAR